MYSLLKPPLLLFILISIASEADIFAQDLKPGFDREEYINLMLISARTANDESYSAQFEEPENYTLAYRSEPIGLDNLWNLWIREDNSAAVISIRGTTQNSESWLQNFYAAMIPASGAIIFKDGYEFTYTLSENPLATVHAGWLMGTAFLWREIQPRLDSLVHSGIEDFLIVGHSQGGAISYLLTAHIRSLMRTGELPEQLRLKTYCSAAPKPGNLFFAYSYEAQTQNGWAYNVVNAHDWVPEMPFSIQTFRDFNPTNPFTYADDIIREQKFPNNLAMRHIYNRLDKPTRRAQKSYSRYLGKRVSKFVVKIIDGLETPPFADNFNYVRTGTTIVLTPDESYSEEFPENDKMIFNHHLHKNYLFLARRLGTPFYED